MESELISQSCCAASTVALADGAPNIKSLVRFSFVPFIAAVSLPRGNEAIIAAGTLKVVRLKFR